ncbi:flagellar brake protein [Simiduia sp. 21SJ11W-1]|uniref:flagellar brake protein n=1 Tax=Simiduia sp. 21SJ11W-1 TaxID=2909669 RepID=UPI0020A108BE|nr:flagellar brake protein [Simiduia sp. 21SJ11W-1]UTA48421.1 flagellar brake protein [Simiduia sp. 21SJ11W-1]
MTFEELKLLPGAQLELDFNVAHGRREASRLIGYVVGRCILVTPPVLPAGAAELPKRGLVEVHLYSEHLNCAILFSAQITGLIEQPVPMLCLGYPAFIAQDESRKATRVATSLAANIRHGELDVAGTIVDLSVSGCRLEAGQALGGPGTSLTLATTLALEAAERRVKVAATVRGVLGQPDDEHDCFSYGLSFDALNDAGKALLAEFIAQQAGAGH